MGCYPRRQDVIHLCQISVRREGNRDGRVQAGCVGRSLAGSQRLPMRMKMRVLRATVMGSPPNNSVRMFACVHSRRKSLDIGSRSMPVILAQSDANPTNVPAPIRLQDFPRPDVRFPDGSPDFLCQGCVRVVGVHCCPGRCRVVTPSAEQDKWRYLLNQPQPGPNGPGPKL